MIQIGVDISKERFVELTKNIESSDAIERFNGDRVEVVDKGLDGNVVKYELHLVLKSRKFLQSHCTGYCTRNDLLRIIGGQRAEEIDVELRLQAS